MSKTAGIKNHNWLSCQICFKTNATIPVKNMETGKKLWLCRKPCVSEYIPIPEATSIIRISKAKLSIKSTPNKGNEVSKRGRTAQWMAHASDAKIPSASQLNFSLNFAIIVLQK